MIGYPDIRFSGFSIMSPLPDHYAGLEIPPLELNLYTRLFEEINSQLKKKEIIVKET